MQNNKENQERIQKVIARNGEYSRRKVEQLILEQRIKVNGKIANIGDKVTQKDKIFIDGIPIQNQSHPKQTVIIAYNKPVGERCSRAETPSVFDNLPDFCDRWVSIGRLDINTSGLLLFCNDGTLANKLMHPSSKIDREYAVRIRGTVTPEIKQNLIQGIQLDDGVASFLDMVDSGGNASNHWFHVVVQEGRHRLIRRLIQSQGLEVSRLMRVRFGTVILTSKIRRGKWVELDKKEIRMLEQLTEKDT